LGTPTDPRLPNGIDAALIVDAYREMEDPADPTAIVTLLRNVARSLKPQGRLGIVDFNPGAGGPGPAPEERAGPKEGIAAAGAAGLQFRGREDVPPFVFVWKSGKK